MITLWLWFYDVKNHNHIDIVSCFYDSICTMLFTKTILLAACFLAKHTACTSRRKNKFQLHDVPNHDKWEMRMFLLKCLAISFQVWWNKIRSWFQTVYNLTPLSKPSGNHMKWSNWSDLLGWLVASPNETNNVRSLDQRFSHFQLSSSGSCRSEGGIGYSSPLMI